MKIFVLLSTFPKLSETFILREIVFFEKNGIDYEIISIKKTKDKVFHSDVNKFSLLRKTGYIYSRYKLFTFIRFCFRLATNAVVDHKFILKIIRSRVSLSNLIELNIAKWILKDAKKDDILYCHFGTVGNIGVLFKQFDIFSGHIGVVFHGYDISQVVKEQSKMYYSGLFLYADFILPISNFWANKLIGLGCPKFKINIHRMGVNSSLYSGHCVKRVIEGKIKIVSVCRLIEKKGIEYALKACSLLIENNVEVEYNIIGDGPLRKQLENYVIQLGLKNIVGIHGEKDQEEVFNLLLNSNIFLLPSVTATNGDMEGIPVSIMEACLLGVPVVSTKHSGIPELIEDGFSGFLAEERNPLALKHKILECINMYKSGSIDQIIQNAKDSVQKEFDTDMNMKRLVNLFLRY